MAQARLTLLTAPSRPAPQVFFSSAFRSPLLAGRKERLPEDIPLLVRHFARYYARQLHKRIDIIPAEALQALTRYCWPGNGR